MITCDYATQFEYGIAAWIENGTPGGETIIITSYPRPQEPPYEYEMHCKPEYPRIDAGLDYYLSPPDPYDYPLSIFAVTWHNHKWIYDPADPQGDYLYEDYDWYFRNFGLNEFPLIYPLPASVGIPPNSPSIWDMYPYIDIDPKEVFDTKGEHVYSHFVVTEGQEEWPDNEAFKVRYTNSNMLKTSDIWDVVRYDDLFSGQATILMYAWQQHHFDTDPDFDIFFISNHGPGGYYRYYSQKFYFEDLYDLEIEEFDEDPVFISTHGYTPPPGELLYDCINVKSPIGALFDWRSEFVAWKEWDSPPYELHHIYGNYEMFEK